MPCVSRKLSAGSRGYATDVYRHLGRPKDFAVHQTRKVAGHIVGNANQSSGENILRFFTLAATVSLLAVSGCSGEAASSAAVAEPTATITMTVTETATAQPEPQPTVTVTETIKAKPPKPKVSFEGDSVWIVGTDIQPGTYRNIDGGDCYWVRLASFAERDIIENGGTRGQNVVTIEPTDKGFETSRCGKWVRID